MPENLTIRMPALSATMEEGELIRWTVAVGDEVRSGQAIAEVVTDKVDMELESPYDGVVAELVAEAGTSVRVGQPVALLTSEADDLLGGLGLDDDDDGGQQPPERATAPQPEPESQPEPAPQQTAITPAPPPVRKRARELGVDLAEITPTGRRGQVTPEDLDAFVSGRDGNGAAAAAPAAAPAPAPAAAPAPARGRREAVRAATARLMAQSAQVPQYVLHRRIDLSRAQQQRDGRSWTTEIARALLAALRATPELCAHWDDEQGQAIPYDGPRLGLAVETGDGLVVVGVDPLDQLTPQQADVHVRDTVRRAREGRLRPDDRAGITCTLSNLGGEGVDSFVALVMPPQPAIVSMGRVAEVPMVVDHRIFPVLSVDLGLSVDHRVADGVQGARLLARVAEALES